MNARQVVGVQSLGWSWKFSTEPGGHHGGDRSLTTDTGRFEDAKAPYLDSGFTIEPGARHPSSGGAGSPPMEPSATSSCRR